MVRQQRSYWLALAIRYMAPAEKGAQSNQHAYKMIALDVNSDESVQATLKRSFNSKGVLIWSSIMLALALQLEAPEKLNGANATDF